MALQASEEVPPGTTYLIPVRLEECAVPIELAKYQFTDIFRESGFEKLVESIFETWAKSQV